MKKVMIIVFVLFAAHLYAHSVIVDGDPADWMGATISTDDTAYIDAGEAIWIDTQGDDVGDGGDAPYAQDDPSGYTYPTDNSFTGGEADIIQCRLTADTQNLYLLVKLDTFSSVYWPLVAITLDVDHIDSSGEMWAPKYADLQMDPKIAWEYAIILGDGGIRVYRAGDTTNIADSVQAQAVFNPNGGYIEAGLNARLLSPDVNILDTVVYYTCMAGLNEFGNFKEVDSVASQWHGGGGLGENGNDGSPYWLEPDVYDLAFVSSDDQVNDLNTYNDNTLEPAVLRSTSAIPVDMREVSGIKEYSQEKHLSLPVIFAPKGYLTFQGNVKNVIIYSKTGSVIGRYESNNASIILPEGAFFALVKNDRGQRLYRIISIR